MATKKTTKITKTKKTTEKNYIPKSSGTAVKRGPLTTEYKRKRSSRGKVTTVTPRKRASSYIHAIGRRKTAIARIRLFEGKEEIIVNGKPISQYFLKAESRYMEPFVTTNTHKKYTATVKVSGSGKNAQLEAFIHGISRALVEVNPERFKPILKKKGFMTRDPRMKETRKVGSAGSKARAKRQSPKR